MNDETKSIIKIAVLLLILLASLFVITHTKKATHLDDAVLNYEQYQDLYNTCQKINTDICNMKDVPEQDIMFAQFSKAQRINTLRSQLNRWIEDYNAKSNMWGRQLWKSSSLPYQLSQTDFPCNTK